jgi:hypothetical protein
LEGDKVMIECFSFRHRYTEQDIVNLNQMHTKQLLKERDRYYSDGCSGNYYTSDTPECEACLANQAYNMTQIKKILATREHVLNKQESKALRKQRIKKGK